jgi:quinol-cytochrome oxidoreductase complex cytochrome b subunit/coenzyme F420-reducing hydrogenase delta subunit
MRPWLRALDHRFDDAFGAGANPLKQLGALAFLVLWLLAATGIVLYALLETSAEGAYRSIGAGGALRGLHRYGADAFALLAVLHLVREWLLGRYAGFRRHSWTTGVILLPLLFACAIGGFWLHWDRLGQFSATATAEWLDALPFFESPLARNFLHGAVGDRLFSLLVFIHLGLPLLLVFGCWAHVQRIGTARVFPRRGLAAGTLLTLLLLALVLPAHSEGPADLASVPSAIALDWLLLFVHPLAQWTSAAATWGLLALALAALLLLPFVPRQSSEPVAQVDPAHCNGCGLCVADCPFAAITLVPHPARRGGVQLAQVRAASCASCGICTGACPSSSPWRKGTILATGIALPHRSLARVRERLRTGGACIVVFGCEHGARLESLADAKVVAVTLPCSGMLPPSFVDYALRQGADRVLVSTCREGGCEFRLGPRWTTERLHGEREPRLRADVPAARWRVVPADAGEEDRLREALETLQ